MEWKQPLILLVAEDDENDVFLLKRAFNKLGINLPCYFCKDGVEAMAYLKGEGQFADRIAHPFPRALITDLKMPGCNGFDLLRWLQEHPECNLIPKIVLSSSAMAADIKLAYQLGTNCYFTKSTNFERLLELVRITHSFWSTAELPELPKNC